MLSTSSFETPPNVSRIPLIHSSTTERGGELQDDEALTDHYGGATHTRAVTSSGTLAVSSPAATQPLEGGGVLSTVQALLSSVDAQSSRMQRTYVESESRRATLQEELQSTWSRASMLEGRATAAEAARKGLEHALRDAIETVNELRARVVELENKNVSLQDRHDASLALLKQFNADYDQRQFDWKQSLDAAEQDVARLRALASEMEGKAALSDEYKARVWSLERQLRTRDCDLDEHAARVRVLECKLQMVERDFAACKAESEALSDRVLVTERHLRRSEHALLTEQFRAKQLESLCETYRAKHQPKEKNVVGDVDAADQDEVKILREQFSAVSKQVVALQLQLAMSASAQGESRRLALGTEESQEAPRANANTTFSPPMLETHRQLEAEHYRATLEKRLAEAEERQQSAKEACLLLGAQVDMLSSRLSSSLENQHAAEAVANSCRREMTMALAREMEATYAKTITEEQMKYHDSAVESLLRSLAHAEELSLSSTAEVDRFRKNAYQANVDLDRTNELLIVANTTIEQQRYTLSSATRDMHAAIRHRAHAEEYANRCSVELEAVCAILTCCQDEVLALQSKLHSEQYFRLSSQETLRCASSRLQVLVGDHNHEASLDDILQYLQTSAATLKEVASTCDDVGRSPPVFYGSMVSSVTRGSTFPSHHHHHFTAKGAEIGNPVLSHEGDLVVTGSGDLRHNRYSICSLRETVLLEVACRNHLIADEAATWHQLSMSAVGFLGKCADYKEHVTRMAHQLQVASEHAANLFRAVKVFSLRQVRKVRVGAQYRELEQLNQTIWHRSHDIHMLLWEVINDPLISLAHRKVIRERLERVAPAVPPSQTSILQLPDLSVGGSGGSSSNVGEMVAQLKLENDRLLEESDRIAQQAANAEARNTALQLKFSDLERQLQVRAWLEASSPPWHSPVDVSSSSAVSRSVAAAAGSSCSLSSLYASLALVTSAAQRADRLVEVYGDFCRRAVEFSETRLIDLHYTGTRNVFDVCVAASFYTALLRGNNHYRNTATIHDVAGASSFASDGDSAVSTSEPSCLPPPPPCAGDTRVELLKAALRASQAQETALSVTTLQRPEQAHAFVQTDDCGIGELPLSSIGARMTASSSAIGKKHSLSVVGIAPHERFDRGDVALLTYDTTVQNFFHSEEHTRLLIQEQHSILLVSLLYRTHEQALWYAQLEQQRVTGEISQSHTMHDGAVQVDHKQQLMSYAKAIDECNQRLVSFMKAKDASEQECARLRGELRRTQDDCAGSRRVAMQHEEAAGELQLRLTDCEERVRVVIRDRDQLAKRLSSFAEQNIILSQHHQQQLSKAVRAVPTLLIGEFRQSTQETQTDPIASVPLLPTGLAEFLRFADHPHGRHSSRATDHCALFQPSTTSTTHTPTVSQPPVVEGAASMFSPFVRDIWSQDGDERDQRPERSNGASPPSAPPARRNVSSSQQQVFSLYKQKGAQSPLRDAHARGFQSLEEWDSVLEAKAQAFLQKEVQWTIKEHQLLTLERELDIRIKETSRESMSLKFQLKEMGGKLHAVLHVAKLLLRSRQARQKHVRALETCIMLQEDPLRSVTSGGGGLLPPPTYSLHTRLAKKNNSCNTGTQVTERELRCSEEEHAVGSSIREEQSHTGWWASTKGVFGRR